MSVGHIGGVASEIVEWKIPDFFSIKARGHIESPDFTLDDCTWSLGVRPKGNLGQHEEFVPVYLRLNDPEITDKTVTYAIGLKKACGTIEEKVGDTVTFKKDKLCFWTKKFFHREKLRKCKDQLAPGGTLTLTCRIERQADDPSELDDSQQFILEELETLSQDLEELLEGERNWDVTVTVQGRVFRAHRALLSARSPVLRAMYEDYTQESRSGLLEIPDCDPDTFADFLRYLYTGRTEGVVTSYRSAYHLYATSEKYDVQRLKAYCTDYLTQELTTENVCEVIVLADRYGDCELLSEAQRFFDANFHAILPTSEWKDMLVNNPRLAGKLLIEMDSAAASK